jgi:hypothetical protein
MKKMTAMVLALGLAVPAQAWHLFPVREKVVIETKTNYTATIITGAVTLLAGIAGVGYMWYKKETEINRLKGDIETLYQDNLGMRAACADNERYLREAADQHRLDEIEITRLRNQ